MSTVEFRVSSHVGQQLRYNQPNLPAALSVELQIIRRKQDAYRQVIQLILHDGKAQLLEVLRGIGAAPLIWHVQCPMNIGAVIQQIYDVEERGLDRCAIRMHRLGRNYAYGRSQIITYSVVQLTKKQRSTCIR
jgi:hypothetical protein